MSVFVGSRVAILLVVPVVFASLATLIPNRPAQQSDPFNAFLQWDGGWYAGIISAGYSWAGPSMQSNVAFFPLYPLLGKIASVALLGNVSLALILVSNLAFLFLLYFLYKLAKRDFDQGTATRSVIYLAIFPLSFYFSAAYTESLMLALAIASFYYAREGRWKLAIVLGTLTTLTRLTGIAILLPLAWEWYKQKGLTARSLYLLLVPAGLGAFMLYLWSLTGDPLAFNTAIQKAWNRQIIWPWGQLAVAWRLVTTLPATRYIAAIARFDFVNMLGFLALTLGAVRSMPAAYWLYSLPVYFVATSSSLDPAAGLPTASVARYLMAIFPAFILMGVLGKNRYIHYLLLFSFALLLGPLMLPFSAGIWVE